MPKTVFNLCAAVAFALLVIVSSSYAQETPSDQRPIDAPNGKISFQNQSDKIIILTAVTFGLTILLHTGFALYEAGLTRKKFVRDGVIRKTLLFAVAVLGVSLFGYALKYPASPTLSEPLAPSSISKYIPSSFDWSHLKNADVLTSCDLAIVALSCATILTIATGAMAERLKLTGYLIFSLLFSTLAFPILHYWADIDSWLGAMEGTSGFRDLGATTLHSVGGWIALAGAMTLGARLNKFKNGKVRAFPGHNVLLAAAGAALAWLGWIGALSGKFNSFEQFPMLIMNFSISGLSALLAAAAATFFVYKKADFSISLSGFLGGLVAATGAIHPIYNAVAIGLVAGILVVWSIGFLEKIMLDDPAGAVPIHLVCGIWGTLAVGILGEEAGFKQFLYQVTGIIAIGALAFGFAFVVFTILKSAKQLRVSEEEELERGLDLSAEEPEALPASEPSTRTS